MFSKFSLPNAFSKNLRDEPLIPSLAKTLARPPPALKPIRPPSAFWLNYVN